MVIMKNKFLLFDSIYFNEQPVRNITDYYSLPDIPDKYYDNEYVLLYLLDNDRLLEAVCLELYETTAYWDLLMKYNGITNTNQLPVNNDTVLIRARKRLDLWIEVGKLSRVDSIEEQYLEVIEILDGTRTEEDSNGNIVSVSRVTIATGEELIQETVKRKYLSILEEEEEKNEKFRNLKYLTIGDMAELESDLSEKNIKIPSSLIVKI